MLRLAALLAALLAPGAAGAAGRLEFSAEAGGGADGNPARAPGAARSPSGFASLLGRARVRLGGEPAGAVLTLTEAGRLYLGNSDADALASRLELAGRARLGGGLSAGLSGAASDYSERAGLLDRHSLRGEGSLELRRGVARAALAGGWSLFTPRERSLRPFRSSGPESWLRLAWAPAEAHRLSAGLGLSRADFPGWAALGAPGQVARTDRAQHLSAEWSWSGPALVVAGWTLTQSRSDAPGGDFTRHRLTASTVLLLPLDLTVAARLALQWSRYPDPLLLAAQRRLAEGQESLDQLELRLTRPLAGPLEASLSLAWYQAQGGAGVAGYERGVATLAVGWRSRAAGD